MSDTAGIMRGFLKIFLPLFLLSCLAFLWVGNQQYQTELKIIASMEQEIVLLQRMELENALRRIEADIRVLAEGQAIRQVIEGDTSAVEVVRRDWVNFAANKGMYDQLRYIDETGQERIRINYNQGLPQVVSVDGLQNKAERYYFKDTMALSGDEIFISPFDLNIEGGMIEQPHKPMIRLAVPVFGSDGQRRGIVIANFLGAHLLSEFEKRAHNVLGDHSLLNSRGYWLYSLEDKTREWGFMLNRDDMVFGAFHPEAWKRIKQAVAGQFHLREGLFTFETVFPLQSQWLSSTGAATAQGSSEQSVSGESYYWKVVSYVANEVLYRNLRVHLLTLSVLFSLMTLLLAGVSITIARASLRREAMLAQLQESIAEKEMLMREIHHRVKNNLSVVQSLLTLQSSRVSDEHSRDCLGQSRDRVRSMALIHDMLFRTEDQTAVNFRRYVTGLVRELHESNVRGDQAINFTLDVDDISLDVDLAVPCGLIINELVTNAFKHAFVENPSAEVLISFKRLESGPFQLIVSDNGSGIDEELLQGRTGSLGMRIIRSLVSQVGGELTVATSPKGTSFTLIFTPRKPKGSRG